MREELKIRLSRYLLDKKIRTDLVKICREKGISSSGNKGKLIDNIIANYSYQEILDITQDIRLSGELNIDYELLSLKNGIGSTFNSILTLAPMSVSNVLMISSLLDGTKKKAEIISNSLFQEFLEIAIDDPEHKQEIAQRILKNARESLLESKLVIQTPRTWEYSLNPHLKYYFHEFQVPKVEQLFERVKQSMEEQIRLGFYVARDRLIKSTSHSRIQVIPAEQFKSSPGLLANISGKLGEELAGRYLRTQGYVVCKLPDFFTRNQGFNQEFELALCPHISCDRESDELDVLCARRNQPYTCSVRNEASDNSLCPCTYQFPQICEGCVEMDSCFIYEYFSLVTLESEGKASKPFHSMDFIAHKNGEHYFVEVKTNSAQTKTIRQAETIEHMKKFGLKTLLVFVTIPINSASYQILSPDS